MHFILASVYEYWVLCNYHTVNQKENLYTCSCGITMDAEDLHKMCEYRFVQEMFHVAGVLQRLNLDQQEIALLKGIIILSTGEHCYEL